MNSEYSSSSIQTRGHKQWQFGRFEIRARIDTASGAWPANGEIDLLSQTLNPDGFNPFLQPHYLLLNLAIGRNGGDPSNSRFPIRYEIDYVRVYQTK